ncbi:MAG: tyrosine-protein phosphatase, partial [Acetobacteraceae bacterium]|nr:tyrosine-protein phosphatase [Acetobacteraceae bacterium]
MSRARAWRDSLLRDHAYFRLAWSNFAEVIPGRVYRANHPPPWRLERWVREHGVQTVINLRGTKYSGSDALSRAAAERLGVDHVDFAFESRGAPQRSRVLRFASLYRTMRMPALLHCKSGADRAGLAAGLVVLLE